MESYNLCLEMSWMMGLTTRMIMCRRRTEENNRILNGNGHERSVHGEKVSAE